MMYEITLEPTETDAASQTTSKNSDGAIAINNGSQSRLNTIKLDHLVPVTLGRGPVTKIKSVNVSRNHLTVQANCEHGIVTITQVGEKGLSLLIIFFLFYDYYALFMIIYGHTLPHFSIHFSPLFIF